MIGSLLGIAVVIVVKIKNAYLVKIIKKFNFD